MASPCRSITHARAGPPIRLDLESAKVWSIGLGGGVRIQVRVDSFTYYVWMHWILAGGPPGCPFGQALGPSSISSVKEQFLSDRPATSGGTAREQSRLRPSGRAIRKPSAGTGESDDPFKELS